MLGTLLLIASLISLAFLDRIISVPQLSSSHTIDLTLSTVFLTFAIFISVQAVQVGLRALITDRGTPTEQAECNAWAGRHTNFASVLGTAPAAMIYTNDGTNGIGRRAAFASSTTFVVHSATGTMILFATVGIIWALNCRIPYSLLGDELYESSPLAERQGLVHGVHNIMICLPQILVTTLMATTWLIAEAERDFGGVGWFFRLAGLSAFVALYFTTKVREQDHYDAVGLPEAYILDEISLSADLH
ncbi:hypothetical protein TSTA_038100 [Talaromyces stipitatus ATCC 10500]|uniref:Uncharacterized protein n=1 Tax=Talaromyces stipitatus (strain ATCC 10500 / CBS 375.48 / QM 6759 / NRRL 1006) TaxID=441959 RepID=B8M8T6_TALSN|nr:uncharacterized protein TSTA_038100 [Talaromyces stipitatus ATCC 10500]EED20599.1 hypothetical protein TSTA_038100 [Talaromyces stipitatus ATCC 10500]